MRPVAARLARNVAWLATGEVALKGALFAAGVLVARGLGPAGMGAFTIAYGAALVLMHVLAMGQVEVLIRETARFPGHGRSLLALSRRFQWRAAAAVLPVAAILALLVREDRLRWALLSFIPYAFLRSWLISVGAVFKGLDRMEVEVGARVVEMSITLPLLALLSWQKGPVWGAGVAFVCGGAVGTAWVLRRVRGVASAAGAPLPAAAMIREGLPFLGLTSLSQLITRADSFLLASLGVAHEEIGHYGVATAPVWGLVAAAQLLAVASFPSLSRQAVAGKLGPRWVAAIAGAGIAVGAALACVLWLVREPLIRVFFGTQYLTSVPVLAVVAWALPGACVSMLIGTTIASLRRQSWNLGVETLVLCALVAANLVAIPRWGVMGCAWVVVGVQYLGAGCSLALAIVVSRLPLREMDDSFAAARRAGGVG